MSICIGNIDGKKAPAYLQKVFMMDHGEKKWGIKFNAGRTTGYRTYEAADLLWTPATNSTAGFDEFREESPIFSPKLCLTKYDADAKKRVVVAYQGDANWADAVKAGGVDYMREFTPFYYSRPSTYEFIVSDQPFEGGKVAPMFMHHGNLCEKVRISAYNIGTDMMSRPGVACYVNDNLDAYRPKARAKGWYVLDYATWCSLSILGLVIVGCSNTAGVAGYAINSGNVQNTGAGDGIHGLTGFRTAVTTNEANKWLGIENFYGNIWKLLDGTFTYQADVYFKEIMDVEKTPLTLDDLKDYTKADGAAIAAGSNARIQEISFPTNADWMMFPTTVGKDNLCYDPMWSAITGTAPTQIIIGGSVGYDCGIFAVSMNEAINKKRAETGILAMEIEEPEKLAPEENPEEETPASTEEPAEEPAGTITEPPKEG